VTKNPAAERVPIRESLLSGPLLQLEQLRLSVRAQRHMHGYVTTELQIAKIAYKNHKNSVGDRRGTAIRQPQSGPCTRSRRERQLRSHDNATLASVARNRIFVTRGE
jgi:hypothetical protein